MMSTSDVARYVKSGALVFAALLGALLALPLAAQPASRAATGAAQAGPSSGDARIPRPAALERDVQFWIRVYTEIPTTAGFLHDERNLAVVYDTLRFPPDTPPKERQRAVDDARERLAALLRKLATSVAGDSAAATAPAATASVTDPGAAAAQAATAVASAPAATAAPSMMVSLTDEERRVLALWGPAVTAERLLEASRGVRFQLGQADRFREGLVRSGRWETHIAQTLANLGLPPELAALPHVESSFNPAAYSKVGAAGLWQFMRSTGRLYMRVDDEVVDERLDPFRSTEAAAQLLAYNYRVLGTWPLALTAYNHGAAGMRRAVEQTGTSDFVTIARTFQSRTFGFASRNFYPSFLAALTIDQNPERYFPGIERAPEMRFHEIELPGYVRAESVARALGVSRDSLRELNPAVREPVWNGARLLPRGYRLRLGPAAGDWTADRLAAALGAGELYAAQIRSGTHKVRSGESLARIAKRYGLSERALAQANGLRPGVALRRGQRLRLPESMPPLLAMTAAAPATTAETIEGVAATVAPDSAAAASPGPTASAAAAPAATAVPAPPASRPAARAPATTGVAAATTTPATPPEFYRVRAGDSLYAIAQRFGLQPAELMRMNRIRDADYLFEGQRLRIRPARDATVLADADEAAEPAEERPATQAAVSEARVREAAAAESPPVEAQTAAVGPGTGVGAASAEFTELAVGRDDTIRVISEETLGLYAEWLDIRAARLRSLNKLKQGQPVLLGRRLKLDFSRVTRADFEQRRRDFHTQLQARYFEDRRITGTEIYIVRRGDSAWAISQRYGGLPAWLLQQYNPDVNLGELRAGTQLIVPKVQLAP